MNRKPINHQEYNFEHEKALTPERMLERTKETGTVGELTEEQVSAARQRDALADIQTKAMLNSLYNPEAEDETQKDHFDIHYFGEYPEERKTSFRIRQEYDLQIICSYTKSDYPQQKIGMYVYPSLEAKQQADPFHTTAKAIFVSDEFRIYRVWVDGIDPVSSPHEITKAVIYTSNSSPSLFFQEGLSIAVDDLAFGYKLQIGEEKKWVDSYMKDLITKELQLPQLSSLFLTENFNKCDFSLIKIISGSFIKYLIQKYGVEKVKQYYKSISKDAVNDQIKSQAMETLGDTLDNLENTWKQSLLVTN